MLRDLKRVTDKDSAPEADDFRAAAARLLKQQFLLRERVPDRESLRLVVDHYEYFESLFDALGWNLHRDDDFGLVGILPDERQSHARLKLVETLMVLCLRLLFEEGMDRFEVRDGCVFTDANNLAERYETLFPGRNKPLKTELREILTRLRQYSLIEMGETDDQGLPRLKILPTIRLITGTDVIARIEAFCARTGDAEADDEDDAEIEDPEQHEEAPG